MTLFFKKLEKNYLLSSLLKYLKILRVLKHCKLKALIQKKLVTNILYLKIENLNFILTLI
jgi:hypothetical protein